MPSICGILTRSWRRRSPKTDPFSQLSTKNPRRDGWDLRPLFYAALIIIAVIVAIVLFAVLRG